MAIHIVKLGSPRAEGEGLRVGTVRRPPRGVPKSEFGSRDYYDVWLPSLAPSSALVAEGLAADNDKTITEWGVKPDRGYEVKLSKEQQTDLAEFMRNLEVIPAKGAKPKEAKPFKDDQREKALEYLREQIKTTGAVGNKGNG